jgi:hypothetical protein
LAGYIKFRYFLWKRHKISNISLAGYIEIQIDVCCEKILVIYTNPSSISNQYCMRCILTENKKCPEKIVFQRNIDIFHQRSFAEISDKSSKLRTYGLIKSEIREEPYLKIVKNIKDRISMTKFRLSNHKLMIEKGRHRNLDKTLRICPFCTSVEDETHFLQNVKPLDT